MAGGQQGPGVWLKTALGVLGMPCCLGTWEGVSQGPPAPGASVSAPSHHGSILPPAQAQLTWHLLCGAFPDPHLLTFPRRIRSFLIFIPIALDGYLCYSVCHAVSGEFSVFPQMNTSESGNVSVFITVLFYNNLTVLNGV